jgi:hypothetical protein
VPLEVLPMPALSLKPSSSLRQAVAWTRMTWRTLPYMLKLKEPCSGFRNFTPLNESPAGALQP